MPTVHWHDSVALQDQTRRNTLTNSKPGALGILSMVLLHTFNEFYKWRQRQACDLLPERGAPGNTCKSMLLFWQQNGREMPLFYCGQHSLMMIVSLGPRIHLEKKKYGGKKQLMSFLRYHQLIPLLSHYDKLPSGP